jgi:hypothetical protein
MKRPPAENKPNFQLSQIPQNKRTKIYQLIPGDNGCTVNILRQGDRIDELPYV